MGEPEPYHYPAPFFLYHLSAGMGDGTGAYCKACADVSSLIGSEVAYRRRYNAAGA